MSRWYQPKKDDIEKDGPDLNVYLDTDESGNIYAEIKIADIKEFCQDKEIIICSAIEVLLDGRIIRGHRHCDCYHNLGQRKEYPPHVTCLEGFITSRNRFVEREVAMVLQVLAGIQSADPGGYRGDILYSEDLY